jgi:hypothetical protein
MANIYCISIANPDNLRPKADLDKNFQPSRFICYVLTVFLHGRLLNGARDIYWQASVLIAI